MLSGRASAVAKSGYPKKPGAVSTRGVLSDKKDSRQPLGGPDSAKILADQSERLAKHLKRWLLTSYPRGGERMHEY